MVVVLVGLVVVHVVGGVEVVGVTVRLCPVAEHSLGGVLHECLVRVGPGGPLAHCKQDPEINRCDG